MPFHLFYPLAMAFVRLRALVFLGLLSFLPMAAHADLQQEMDAMFGTMGVEFVSFTTTPNDMVLLAGGCPLSVARIVMR